MNLKTVFWKIYLLIWKNFLLRRKHCCATVLLVWMPLSIISMLVYGWTAAESLDRSRPSERSSKSRASKGRANENNFGYIKDGEFTIPNALNISIGTNAEDINHLVELLIDQRKGRDEEETLKELAYSPSSDTASGVMHEILNLIKGGNGALELKSYTSESGVENNLHSWKDRSKDWKPFRAALIFKDLNNLENRDGIVQYKIRIVARQLHTDLLRNLNSYEGIVGRYKKHGFTALQILTDNILIERMTKGKNKDIILQLQEFPLNSENNGFDGHRQGQDSDYGDSPRHQPHTLSLSYEVKPYLYHLLPHCIICGFILCVPSVIRGVISEKQSGIKELMQMMGLSNWMHWTGWMLDSLFFMGITVILMTFMLFYPFITTGLIALCSVPLWLLIMFLYLIAIISFCFFISTFFSKATLAISIGLCCYLASYYGLVIKMGADDLASTLGEKIASCLLPNMALHWALIVILHHESPGQEGAGWHNLAEPINNVNQISLLPVIGMLVVDIIIYLTLTMYFEKILPSEFGVQKPWYYIFQLSTWISEKREQPVKTVEGNPEDANKDNNREEDNKMEVADVKQGFEEEPMGLTIGIEICDMTKRFDRQKMAVNGISAKMYNGEITVLLGHNGAGKTTTMSILTGIIGPTSGTAFIKGYDITTSMDEIRKSLGLCPQFDMLFNELTVEQHLVFFGRLKGLSKSAAKQEAEQIQWRLKLGEKCRTESCKLSGGQKRRLSLANAIIGGSSVLILDEPTSGLDPEARREVWDLLLALRGARTILLTTHFMEEADVLGDRIFIMAEGKMQCSGTSLFLKKLYGDGYTIILTTEEEADANAILSVVQKYIPQAYIDTHRANSSKSQFTITLPEEFTKTSIFPDLFGDLCKQKKKLGILTIGSSIATMDDVFVKVGELNHPVEDDVENFEDVTNSRSDNYQGFVLLMLMFWGLMIKLFIRNIRNTKLVLLQLLPPIIAISLVCSLISGLLRFDAKPSSYPSQKISLRGYGEHNPISICKPMSKEAETMCYTFATVIGGNTHILGVDEKSLVDFLIEEVEKNFEKYTKQYFVAAEMTKGEAKSTIKVMHSPFYTHAEPFAINAASNTLLKLVTNNSSKRIEVINHPLKTFTAGEYYEAADASLRRQDFPVGFMFAMLLPLGIILLTASFVLFPTEERLCNGKQLQRMVGVSPLLYWTSAFLWDFIMLNLITCAMLICVFIFQPYEMFTDNGAAGAFFMIFVVYYFSILPTTYLTSVFCSTSGHGFVKLVVFHLATALLFSPMMVFMEPAGEDLKNTPPPVGSGTLASVAFIFRIILSLNPTFGFVLSIFKFAVLSLKVNKCNVFSDLDALCRIIPESFYNTSSGPSAFIGCCDNVGCPPSDFEYHEAFCLFHKNNDYCHVKYGYLTWDFKAVINLVGRSSCYNKTPGIGQELFAMFIVGVIYYILLFLVEYDIPKKIFRSSKSLVSFQANYPTDDDVIDEAARVHAQVFTTQAFDMNQSAAAPMYQDNVQMAGVPMQNIPQYPGAPMNQDNVQMAGVPMQSMPQYPGAPMYPTQNTGVSKYQNQNVAMFFNDAAYAGAPKKNSGQYQGAPMVNTIQNAGVPELPIRNKEVDGKMDEQSISNNSAEKRQNEVVAVEMEETVQVEEEDALLVQNLCKSYKDFAAVSNISFGVKHGECFGLLGVNGAGKTTTFRMLTGDETPSMGNAVAEGYTLRDNKSDFVRQFGYCPQFDAIVPFMTGKEMLMFYGRLRGVPPKYLKREVEMWLAKLGLTKSANVISKKYSGGMKRRLGAGMALVGHPPIILLDEPTSGVDPISRRQFWKIISSVQEAGQAVILTSHSMEECEALCSRLGIMVNGQFQCFGGVQHLKNKFGQGHSLTMKLKANASVDNPQDNAAKTMEYEKTVADLQNALVSKFQNVILKDQHSNVLQYQLLDTAIDLGQIFKVMEELKGKFEIIEHYSVGDTTLEEVFLSFARLQYGARSAS